MSKRSIHNSVTSMADSQDPSSSKTKRKASQELAGHQQKKARSGVTSGRGDTREARQDDQQISTYLVTQTLNLIMIIIATIDYANAISAQIEDAKASQETDQETMAEEVAILERKLAIVGDQQYERTVRLTKLICNDKVDITDPNFFMLPPAWFRSVQDLAENREQIASLERDIAGTREQLEIERKAWEAVFDVAREPMWANSPRVHVDNILQNLQGNETHFALEETVTKISNNQDQLDWLRRDDRAATDRLILNTRDCFIDSRFFPTAPEDEEQPVAEASHPDADSHPGAALHPGADLHRGTQKPLKDVIQETAQTQLKQACRALNNTYKAFEYVRHGYSNRRHHFFSGNQVEATPTEFDLQYFLARGDANHQVVQAEADLERLRGIAQAVGALPEDQITSGFQDRADDGYAESLMGYMQDHVDKDRIQKWLAKQPDTATSSYCNANADACSIRTGGAAFQGSMVDDEERTYSNSLRRKLDAYKSLQDQWRVQANAVRRADRLLAGLA